MAPATQVRRGARARHPSARRALRATIHPATGRDAKTQPPATRWMVATTPAGESGAFVGKTKNEGGKGVMVDYRYLDGARFLPSNDQVKKLRAPE